MKRKLITAAAVVAALFVALYAWTTISPTEVRAEVTIDAPPAEVWEVLTDFEAYQEWNPFIVSATGQAQVDTQLTNVMANGDETRTFTPRVVEADSGQELRWIGRFGLPGLVDGEHQFVLEDLGDGRTRLVQTETFTGVLVPFAGDSLDVEDDFKAMNTALKDRVELADDRT